MLKRVSSLLKKMRQNWLQLQLLGMAKKKALGARAAIVRMENVIWVKVKRSKGAAEEGSESASAPRVSGAMGRRRGRRQRSKGRPRNMHKNE